MSHWSLAYGRSLGVLVVFVATLLALRNLINEASAGFLLLLAVVFAGRFSGMGPALVTAGLASLTYLFLFLRPVGLSVDDPNDWIALLAFLLTGVVAGSMLAQTERAIRQRDHFERLYWTLYGKSAAREEGNDEVR